MPDPKKELLSCRIKAALITATTVLQWYGVLALASVLRYAALRPQTFFDPIWLLTGLPIVVLWYPYSMYRILTEGVEAEIEPEHHS